jgi:Uma2 family endonuclease
MTMTPSSPAKRLMTVAELLRLPDVDGQHELVRGELIVHPLNGARHGAVATNVAVHLGEYVVARDLGTVLLRTGYVLERSPDTVRAPDVSFVSAARLRPEDITDDYMEGSPDLAVEVIAPTDTQYEVDDRIAEFLAAGTGLAWVINPHRRTVAVHAPGAPVHFLDEADAIDAGDVVPGFRCTVRELME